MAVYTKEFMQECVRYYNAHSELTYREAAAGLGINCETLSKWVRKDAEERGEMNVSDHAELRELRAKVARLEEENEILKKAAAFFARDAI